MTSWFASMMRRAAPFFVLMGVVLVALAFAPIGQALWNKVLTVDGRISTAEPPTAAAAAEPMVEFSVVGLSCDMGGMVWAELRNTGGLQSDATVEIALWYQPEDSTDVETLAGVQALDSLQPGATTTVSMAASAGSGRYAFTLLPPDPPDADPVRSDDIDVDLALCEIPLPEDPPPTDDLPPEDPPPTTEPPPADLPPEESPPTTEPPAVDPP